MTYQFLAPALRELTEASEYYETQVAGLGVDFLDEVDASISRILQFPKTWSLISATFRQCSLRRFPYTIIYSLPSPTEVLMVSVFHQHRQPLSWKQNLK